MENLLTNGWIVGIGTTTVGGLAVSLVAYHIFGVGKEKKSSNKSQNYTKSPHVIAGGSISAGRDIIVGNREIAIDKTTKFKITLQEISNNLKKTPPLQREQVAKNYEGLKVSWKLNFISAYTLSQKKNTYNLYLVGNNSSVVNCSVPKKSYPQLSLINEGHKIQIEGEIESINSLNRHVKLKNCKLNL